MGPSAQHSTIYIFPQIMSTWPNDLPSAAPHPPNAHPFHLHVSKPAGQSGWASKSTVQQTTPMSPNAIPRCRKRKTSGSCMSVAPSWFYNEAIARFEATQQIAWIAKIFAQFSNPFKGPRGWEMVLGRWDWMLRCVRRMLLLFAENVQLNAQCSSVSFYSVFVIMATICADPFTWIVKGVDRIWFRSKLSDCKGSSPWGSVVVTYR